MFMPFDPPADPNCKYCRGESFIVKPRGEFALAEVCACVPHCKRCNGTGRVVIERNGVRQVGRCRCQKLPDRIRLFNLAQIPARHSRSSFQTFDYMADPSVIPAFGEAQKWAQDFVPGEDNRGLIFWGMVGRGKTHLLIATLRELIFRHGVAVRFVEFSRLLSILKENYSRGRSDSEMLNELVTIPVLGIDELGKGRMSEWELTIIDEVVSRRYNAMGCMLGTTNYRPGEPTGTGSPNLALPTIPKQTLGDRVGSRVYSRMEQMTSFVQTRGQDYRKRKGYPGSRLTALPSENAG